MGKEKIDWQWLIANKDAVQISTDTRNLEKGCIYFALKGERFDGNKFAVQALAKGAGMVIVSDAEVHEAIAKEYGEEKSFLLPEDLRERGGIVGLQSLARAWREEVKTKIIAVTGTNGKTTTKELLSAVLQTSHTIYATKGNLNNSIGVPLTLLSLTRAHELAIVEMGASHPGDIKELVDVALPDYGLITNVGRAHLEGFGSFEGVKSTKKELYDYCAREGKTVFINEDNSHLKEMWHDAVAQSGKSGDEEALKVGYRTGKMLEGTHLVGAYNAENIQAALCVGAYFGIEEEKALAAVRAYVPTNHRSQLMKTENGNTVVVDAYNANPTSMQSAIEVFKGDMYILGAMRELGEYSRLEHQNISNMLAERRAKDVFLVGKEWKETTTTYPVFDDVDELISIFTLAHPAKCHILVKGSHSTQLEKILPYL